MKYIPENFWNQIPKIKNEVQIKIIKEEWKIKHFILKLRIKENCIQGKLLSLNEPIIINIQFIESVQQESGDRKTKDYKREKKMYRLIKNK